ncbi:MAG: HisA/HisF-related TIM barrel protein [Alphaproteobacteria bacterium]|jgi:imidazole glycerol-phosphate synthase subunit HisF|nr:HisA/HisF-related TIM barrel protein [Alphaproteobacteria bacterium]
MPKKRIIGCLLTMDGHVVQSIGFKRFLPVGRPEVAVRFLDEWGVDEIILLDMAARSRGELIDVEMVTRCATRCHVPLGVGGGITGTQDVRDLVRAGADKVLINDLSFQDASAVRDIVAHFGSQCFVGAMDVRHSITSTAVRRNRGLDAWGDTPLEWARYLTELGAGELLINSIDHDGQGQGYDLALVGEIADASPIPVITLGGAGHPDHVRQLFTQTRAGAAAIGNMLHYTEHSIALLKSALVNAELDIRLDSQADYTHVAQTSTGRVSRREEADLVDEVFTFLPPEVI